jgi:23S rRNA (adenine2030-N6)-methyltransferase
MNYRHIFHAGNLCDVVKHAVLTLVIDHLRNKETPFCVLDTHAGLGLYDLSDPRAAKTDEAKDGILKLLDAARLPELDSYYAILKKLNMNWDGKSSEGFRYYPGSPLLALHLLRKQDRLIACELHPEDAEELKRQLFPYKQAQTHRRDGYEALKAFLPPPEKRGLVLIDPPFEVPDEFEHLATALRKAHVSWPQGIFIAWYPIKERPAIWRFHEFLAASGMSKILVAEFIYREETQADQLNGSGLILMNPPWQMDEKLRRFFPVLRESLRIGGQEDKVAWLAQLAN